MGYYVDIIGTKDFCIKKDNFDSAYRALCALNCHDEMKTGGKFGGQPTSKPEDSTSCASSPDRWFAWMPWNYDEVCENLTEILQTIGFDISTDKDGNIVDLAYDNKTGCEEKFLLALSPYIEDGGQIAWRGEDGACWRHVFTQGQMYEDYIDFFA